MDNAKINSIVDGIFQLYEQYGADEYAGEKVSQLEHMYQAARFAMEEGYDDEVVLAAFLHDMGHLIPLQDETESMDGYGMKDHEKVGADYLRRLGFGERLCKLIASHVNAKRYLTATDSGYYEALSEASKRTLAFQGGKMDAEEARLFEEDPLFDLYIKMRRWDEAAKIEGQPVPGIAIFREKTILYLVRLQT